MVTVQKPLVTEEQMRKRVQKGIKLLDKKNPGWHKKVKLKTLDLHDDGNCILGQVYDSFWMAIGELGLVETGFGINGINAALDAAAPLWPFI